ncbi:MAG: IS630 family transposase, partial [Acidobacteriota bacterium]|nr:IS630 family transposase [Acidobacteriota bacterium]
MFSRAAALALTDDQKAEIQSLVRRGSTPQRVATKGRLILLAQQGLANHSIAKQLSVSRPTVLAVRSA